MMVTNNKSKDIRTFTLFFIGWFLYFTQGALRIHGMLTQVILVVMLLWSFYYYFRLCSLKGLNPILKSLSYLLLLFVFYGLINLIFNQGKMGDVSEYEYIKKAAISIVPIFGFYYLLRRVKINDTWFAVVLIMLLLSAIGEFYSGRLEIQQKIANGLMRDRDTSEMVVSGVYRFLPILPMLFFVKKTWFKYSLLFIILVYAVMGLKRGPILMCAVSLFVILLDELKQTKKHVGFSQILALTTAVSIGYYVLSSLIAENDFLISRFDAMLEGDTSNREIIYASIYDKFINEPNVFLQLIGHGADSTLRLVGCYAHNDWLEIALNQGFLGLFIYLLFYINFFNLWRKTNNSHDVHLSIGLFLILTIATSYLSMSINSYRIAAHFCFAYCLVMSDIFVFKKYSHENLCS